MVGIGEFSGAKVNSIKKAALGDEGMIGHMDDRPAVANQHPHTMHSVGYAGKSYTNHGIEAFHVTHSERDATMPHTYQ